MKYGYIRKNKKAMEMIALEYESLLKEDIRKTNIFVDLPNNKSGLRRILEIVKPNDQIVIVTISSFGTTLQQQLVVTEAILKKAVNIVILEADIELNASFLSTIPFWKYLGEKQVAEKRENGKQAVKTAKQNGKRVGREKKSRPENFQEIKSRYLRGELSLRQAGKLCNVSHHTFSNWIKK